MIFESDKFSEYKSKCIDFACNVDQWYANNIENNYFKNDDDFEKLKKSPNKFEKKQQTEEDALDIYRQESFKLFTSSRAHSFKHSSIQSPRKRASKKQAANARGLKYSTMNDKESRKDQSSQRKMSKVGSSNALPNEPVKTHQPRRPPSAQKRNN